MGRTQLPGPQERAVERENARQLLVKLVFAVFWIMLVEGALRKWFLPQLNQVIFFLRDPVVLYTYFLAFKNRLWPPPSPIIYFTVLLMIVFLPMTVLQIATHGLNPVVCAYGYRMYFLYIPLAFLIGNNFRVADLKSLIKQTIISAIAMAPLVLIQWHSPVESFINKLPSAEQVATVGKGIVRPTGTFTHSVMMPIYIGFVWSILFSLWLIPSKQRGLSQVWIWGFTACSMALLAFTGNRASYLYVLLCVVASFIFAALLPAKRRMRTFGILCALILGAGILGMTIFGEGMKVMLARMERAQANEGSLLQRAETNAREGGDSLSSNELCLYGNGIGIGSGGGSTLIAGHRAFLTGEAEWPRVINECGLFGLLYLAWRGGFAALLFWKAIQAVKRTANPLPILLCSMSVPILAIGQLTLIGGINAFGWILVGFNIAANGIGLVRVSDLENRMDNANPD